jgi:hypothetical protein
MAAMLPMLRAVGELRLVPVMVTNVPTEPEAGVKEVMVGVCPRMLRLNSNAMIAIWVALEVHSFCKKNKRFMI